MSVTIRARLPKADTNGLAHLENKLAEDPDAVIVVVGLIRADTIEARPHDDDNPQVIKTVMLHIEAVEDGRAAGIEKTMRKLYEGRTGKKELPFEEAVVDSIVVEFPDGNGDDE